VITRVVGRLRQLLRSSPGRPGPLHVTAKAASHVGYVRPENEDAWLIERILRAGAPPATLLLVADGMGGAAAGEVASGMAADVVSSRLTQFLRGAGRFEPGRLTAALAEAMSAANREIRDHAARDARLTGMGTTATAMVIVGDLVCVGHVGDSRGYLIREGRAERLTRDHSFVQHLVDRGEMTAADAARSQHRNALLRALGPRPSVAADVATRRLRDGDTVLLCSDGLWSAIDDDEIADLVSRVDNPARACAALVDTANARGGRDNVTVVIGRLHVEDAEVPGPSALLAVDANRA
jgi:protein phosphatase